MTPPSMVLQTDKVDLSRQLAYAAERGRSAATFIVEIEWTRS